jgi:hypothetical protein
VGRFASACRITGNTIARSRDPVIARWGFGGPDLAIARSGDRAMGVRGTDLAIARSGDRAKGPAGDRAMGFGSSGV